jgi:hypothetical protein
MKNTMKNAGFICALLILAAVFSCAAYAAPTGPDSVTVNSTSRRGNTPAVNTSAVAGNVTGLNINITWVTNSWQGYFGNISGVIVLDDANNKSMYSWVDASPSGEIYAVRTSNSIAWANVNCTNLTMVLSEETAMNIESAAKDGINETFNKTSSTDFYVGSKRITAGACSFSQFLYENDAAATQSNFEEILLSDGTYIVYTSIINQNKIGFDNAAHDFQMIVPENGRNGDSSVTNYYFYVELN